MDNNIKNIAVYGSCISRDPFTTRFNKDYKKKYNCVITDQKHSFISTVQEKENVFESGIFLPENEENSYKNKCIKDDLERTFIDLMLSNDIDYLIFDINFEVQTGVISYDDGKFLSNPEYLKETEFYSRLSNVVSINIFENPVQYFELWCSCCDKFFNFLETNCPETKVILAEVRALDVVQRRDLSRYVEQRYSFKSKLSNIYYKKLEDYIKENYDVYVISFDKDTVLKENHVWGKYFVHYDDSYYINFLKSVDRIVEYDQLKRRVEFLSKENESLSNDVIYLKNQLQDYIK